MSRIGLVAVLVVLTLAPPLAPEMARAEGYPHAQEPIGTVREMYDGALTPDLAVNTFRNIDRLFPTRRIAHGANVWPLPRSDKPFRQVHFQSGGREWDLFDYLAVNRVAGLLILKDGRIAMELYQYGNTERTHWMSMSIAKSVTATLIASALQQKLIGSLDDGLEKYVPRLAGSVYAGVSIRDILMMSSGVRWNETYTDPASDRRRLLEVQIQQRPGAVLELMAGLSRAAPPGTVNNYSTGETQIAGEVLHGAIRRPLSQYLSERIWSKFAMEADASWWLASADGMEIAGSGMSATLRDYGRFGLFILGDGKAGGEQILPPGWAREAGARQRLKNGQLIDYGYFWWPAKPTPATPDPGAAFSGVGIFGQYLYINPAENVVIASWGARSKPSGRDIIDDTDFCAAVVRALR